MKIYYKNIHNIIRIDFCCKDMAYNIIEWRIRCNIDKDMFILSDTEHMYLNYCPNCGKKIEYILYGEE